MPFSNAVANTVISGANSNAARNSSDTPMKAPLMSELTNESRPGRLASSARMTLEGPTAI